jgi:hypothetical protein
MTTSWNTCKIRPVLRRRDPRNPPGREPLAVVSGSPARRVLGVWRRLRAQCAELPRSPPAWHEPEVLEVPVRREAARRHRSVPAMVARRLHARRDTRARRRPHARRRRRAARYWGSSDGHVPSGRRNSVSPPTHVRCSLHSSVRRAISRPPPARTFATTWMVSRRQVSHHAPSTLRSDMATLNTTARNS